MRRLSLPAIAALTLCVGRTAQAQTARVAGVVYDSVARAPMRGAVVQLVSNDRATVRSATTDSLGQFSVDTVAAGHWMVAAMHPRIDALGVTQLARELTVGRSGIVRTTLAVPSPRRLTAQVCGDSIAGDTLGYLRGTLREAVSARGGVQGNVRVSWLEWTLAKGGPRTSIANLDVATAADGAFIVCGVPRDAHVRVRAWRGADSSGVLEVEVPSSGIYARDLYLGPKPELVTSDSGTVVRGPARLVGRALRPDGQPLAGVRVVVREARREVLTNDDGRFLLDSLPIGTWSLGARAVGYSPTFEPVDLLAGDANTIDITLDRLQYLDPIVINARRSQLAGVDLREFQLRQKSGMGRYLDVGAIDRYNPIWTSDIFTRTPGLILQNNGASQRVMMKTDDGGACPPLIYVGDMLLSGDDRFSAGEVDHLVDLNDVLGVEIYTRKALAPPQYQSFTSDCGAIVFWTGRKRLEAIGLAPKRR